VQAVAIHQFLGSGMTAGRGALKGLVGVCGVFAGVFTGGGAVAGILFPVIIGSLVQPNSVPQRNFHQ